MFKLGRNPSPPRKLARRLMLKDYLPPVLPPIPPAFAWEATDETFDLLGNSEFGDCVGVALANLIRVWCARTEQPYTITTADVLDFYTRVAGFDPNDPSTDNGMDMLSALAEFQKNGIGGVKCGPYVAIDPTNQAHMQAATYLFGGIDLGITVTQGMMDQFDADQPWDGTGDQTVLGGHAVASDIYGPRCLETWGREQPAPGIAPDEAYAILWPGWERDPLIVQLGLDVPKLTAALNAVQG